MFQNSLGLTLCQHSIGAVERSCLLSVGFVDRRQLHQLLTPRDVTGVCKEVAAHLAALAPALPII